MKLFKLSIKNDWVIFVHVACYFQRAQTRRWAFGTVKQVRGLSAWKVTPPLLTPATQLGEDRNWSAPAAMMER